MVDKNVEPVRQLAVTLHPFYSRAKDALELVLASCRKWGIEAEILAENHPPDRKPPFQAVVSVGGDGTLLHAVGWAYPANIPVWGVNVGHLGFLTTSGLDEIEAGIEALAKGDYWIEQRSMIQAEAHAASTGPLAMVALNDIVVHRDVTRGQLSLEAELDGHFLARYEGDGLIVATPTGSTAYALSAGGPILSPTLAAFLLTPICCHSLSARSLVFDDASVLVIRPSFNSPGAVLHVTADGRSVAQLKGGAHWHDLGQDGEQRVVIRRADRKAGLIRFGEVVFSEVLRDKLGWAGVSPPNRVAGGE